MMFKHPHLLWLLVVLIPMVVWYVWKRRKEYSYINLSSTRAFAKIGSTWKVWLIHLSYALKMLAVAAIIVALARPQTYEGFKNSTVEGTDIVLVLDISGTMLTRDMQPNRINAAKEVATKFVGNRENDNMGLVIFSGESLSLMPLTNDRGALINAIKEIQVGALTDGTAIGDGLSSAINRLMPGQAKSKSIILLTDGVNNAGDVQPSTAAEIAKQNGMRVYTIGIGRDSSVTIPDPYGYSSTVMETKIDEDLLRSIAKSTGGKYFRAVDKGMLEQVFDEIDQLEKSRIDVERYSHAEENYMPWLWLALGLFLAQLVLRYVVLKRIP